MKITVTQEDIDEGIIKDCIRCPIARAIGRAFGEKASVAQTDYYVSGRWNSLKPKKLPNVATEFIYDFDAGRPVHPFTFELPDYKFAHRIL
jgi:hypothetical protein